MCLSVDSSHFANVDMRARLLGSSLGPKPGGAYVEMYFLVFVVTKSPHSK